MSSLRRSVAIRSVQAFTIAVFLVVWELLVRNGIISSAFLAAPTSVASQIILLLGDQSVLNQALLTIGLVGLATITSSVIGISSGVILGTMTRAYEIIDPYIVALFTLPKIILLPLVFLLFGYDLEFQFIFGVIHGFFPIFLQTVYAVRSVQPTSIRAARSMGASNLQIYRKIIFPSASSSLLAGVRLCFNLSFLGVLLGQMFAGTTGLGYLAEHFTDLLDSQSLGAIIVLASLVAFAFNEVVIFFEERVTRWKRP